MDRDIGFERTGGAWDDDIQHFPVYTAEQRWQRPQPNRFNRTKLPDPPEVIEEDYY
jgi:hypothetical protein